MMSMSKPTFELGKSYRAVNKAVMKIVDVHPDGGFRARQIADGDADPNVVTVVYNIRGIVHQPGWSDYNLFCGAVEDGPDAASTESKERLQNLVDGAHIRCDVLTSRVTEIERARAWIATFKVKQFADEINKRLDEQKDRMQLMGINLAKRCSDLSERLDEAYAEAGRQTECIDNLEKHCAAMQGKIEALERTRGAFTSLLNKLGYEIGDYGRVQLKRQQASIKRVIKGGWVNVLRDRSGKLHIGYAHDTKETADSLRADGISYLACIQIPDITEGEGL